MNWLFFTEQPLPSGFYLAKLHNGSSELGAARLREAGAIVGNGLAEEAAARLGRYQLSDERVRELGLAGVDLSEDGEFPALSPERWGSCREAECWEGFEARLAEEGSELAGIQLSRSQQETFLRFLARNHVSTVGEMSAGKVVGLARHFFFTEPVSVVVRHTPPRFTPG